MQQSQQLTMEQFFSRAGAYVTHNIYGIGESPQTHWIVETVYHNGYSRYDGSHWEYSLN